jgi:hypothetical protein
MKLIIGKIGYYNLVDQIDLAVIDPVVIAFFVMID